MNSEDIIFLTPKRLMKGRRLIEEVITSN